MLECKCLQELGVWLVLIFMNLVVYKSWLAISQKVINHTKNSKNINPFSSRFIWQTPILNLLNLCGMFSAETCQILLDATLNRPPSVRFIMSQLVNETYLKISFSFSFMAFLSFSSTFIRFSFFTILYKKWNDYISILSPFLNAIKDTNGKCGIKNRTKQFPIFKYSNPKTHGPVNLN